MKPRGEGGLPGIWGELAAKFSEPLLCCILGCTTETLRLVALNRRPPTQTMRDTVEDLCTLHGVRPRLYVYEDWVRHNDVVISDTPAGWRAWSLRTTAWAGKNSLWIGNPGELRPVEDPALLVQAREYGWPW